MTNPTTAYDLLDQLERDVVDNYVEHVRNDQKANRERIALALSKPMPTEHVRRSKGLLNKPLVRVAIQEKIQSIADEEDLSPTRVIKEHAAIAFSTIKDFMEPSEFGEVKVKNLKDIPDELAGAIKTMRTIPTAYGNRVEIILHEKLTSLKIMGELMGLVAPDTPPVLRDYASGAKTEKEALDNAPADAYQQLLESIA